MVTTISVFPRGCLKITPCVSLPESSEQGQVICPSRANQPFRRRVSFVKSYSCGRAKLLASLFISDFRKLCLTAKPKQAYCDAVPPTLEGRFAIVTDVGGGMRWTQGVPKTRALICGRRSRVVLTPRRWCQVLEKQASQRDGWNEAIPINLWTTAMGFAKGSTILRANSRVQGSWPASPDLGDCAGARANALFTWERQTTVSWAAACSAMAEEWGRSAEPLRDRCCSRSGVHSSYPPERCTSQLTEL
jgi:hypothetical protein